ncbi:MAG TPA: GNAT family N-acetyltransferase [Solirubrobacterales bacterium]|nr:GNAT family N-acetyltransferase [Solirubrobacterales bacterium]
MLRIRDATPADAAAIAEANAAGWRRAYRGLIEDRRLDAISTKVWARDIRGTLEDLDEGWFSLVAELDGRFAGSCFVAGPARDGDLGQEVAELVGIYVDPPLWGRGIGTALLSAAQERAAADGFDEMVLWTLIGNERAESLYEHLGWQRDGSERFDPTAKAPTVRMRKPLGTIGTR